MTKKTGSLVTRGTNPQKNPKPAVYYRGVKAAIRLATDNIRLAYRFTDLWLRRNPHHKDTYDRQDAYQDAWLGLVEAARRFDADRGFAFSTYASNWVFLSLQGGAALTPVVYRPVRSNAKSHPDRQEAKRYASETPFSALEYEDSGKNPWEPCEVFEDPLERQEQAERVKELLSVLTLKQRLAVRMYYAGRNFREIAKAVGACHESVRQWYYAGMEKLKEHVRRTKEVA